MPPTKHTKPSASIKKGKGHGMKSSQQTHSETSQSKEAHPMKNKSRSNKESNRSNKSLNQTMRYRKPKSNSISFARYIHRVLKHTLVDSPSSTISKKAMEVMDNMCLDLFRKIARETSTLVHHAKMHTLRHTDIHSALMLLVPGELGNFMRGEGIKAVKNYYSSMKTGDGAAGKGTKGQVMGHLERDENGEMICVCPLVKK